MAATKILSSSEKPCFLVGQFASCGPYLVKSGLLSIPSDGFFPTKDLETNPLNSTKFLCIYIYIHNYIYIYINYDTYIYIYYTCIIGECHETCIFFQGLKGLQGTLNGPGPGTKLRSAIDEARQRIEAYEDRSAVTWWPDDLRYNGYIYIHIWLYGYSNSYYDGLVVPKKSDNIG